MNHGGEQRHAIHLGGAWEPPAPGSPGCVTWRRWFGRPDGVAAGQRVALVVMGGRLAATVRVNGVCLPPLTATSARWEAVVTSLLRDRNELLLEIRDEEIRDGLLPGGEESQGRRPLPAAVGRVTLEIIEVEDRGCAPRPPEVGRNA